MIGMEEWLIVDGYNVIGVDSDGLFPVDSLEEARYTLVRMLSEYQAVTGRRVIVVFDAHEVPGPGSRSFEEQVMVVFTRRHETADERIERLVSEMSSVDRRIYVATSDYLEQRMIFGRGAYRISSPELIEEIKELRKKTKEKIEGRQVKRVTLFHGLDEETIRRLEGIRRKK